MKSQRKKKKCQIPCSVSIAKYVRFGDLDSAQSHTFNIIEKFVYPLYKAPSFYHDIALLKIDGPIEFNEYIRPACIADANTMIAKRVISTGWGSTSYRGDIHSHLQKVQLNVSSYAECNTEYAERSAVERGIVNETQICAGSAAGERDGCQVSYKFNFKDIFIYLKLTGIWWRTTFEY